MRMNQARPLSGQRLAGQRQVLRTFRPSVMARKRTPDPRYPRHPRSNISSGQTADVADYADESQVQQARSIS
jgi:hypothetical protein